MKFTKSLLRFLFIVLLPIPLVAQRPCLVVEDLYLEKDSIYQIPVKAIHFDTVVAFQFKLKINTNALSALNTPVLWEPLTITSSINDQLKDNGWLIVLWTDETTIGIPMEENETILHVTFRANQTGLLSNFLSLDNSVFAEHADQNQISSSLSLTYLEGTCDNAMLGYSGAIFKDPYQRPISGMQVGKFSQRVSQKNGSLLFLFDSESAQDIQNRTVPVLSGVDVVDFQLLRNHLNKSTPFQRMTDWLAADIMEDRLVDDKDLDELFLQLFEISDYDWEKTHLSNYSASINTHESSPGVLVAPVKQTAPVQYDNPRLDSFLVIKRGDFNGSYVPGFTSTSSGVGRNSGVNVEWSYNDRILVAGQTNEVTVRCKPFSELLCMVAYLETDPAKTKIKQIKDFNTTFWGPSIVKEVSPGKWKLVWYNLAGKATATEIPLFTVVFEDLANGMALHEVFRIANDQPFFTVADIEALSKGKLEMTYAPVSSTHSGAELSSIVILNPVKSALQSLDGNFPMGTASVYDLQGRQVLQFELKESINSLALPNIPDGNYVLLIREKAIVHRARFVKIQSDF